MSIQKRFLVLGAALFLAGLVTGFLPSAMANPRMALSSHLEAVMNGIFLIAVGAAWPFVTLGPRALAATFWLFAYGAVANWLSTLLAAAWGAGAMMPIAAPNHAALPWQEAVVTFGLVSLSLAMIVGTVLLLVGFIRAPSQQG